MKIIINFMNFMIEFISYIWESFGFPELPKI